VKMSIPSPQRQSVVGVVGAGYVGLTAAACFAALGHRVRCVEQDADRLAILLHGDIPIYEPGLDALVSEGVASGKLTFTADMGEAVSGAAVAFLCVGTPPRTDGCPDLRPLAVAAAGVARAATGDLVVAIKSTVPPGTCEAMELVAAEAAAPGLRIDVVSNPEFLRESQAVSDFFSPDRIVVGSDHEPAGVAVSSLYPQAWPMLRCDRRSAELVKYASNTFLALKISFANEIAGVCEHLGADAVSVLAGVGMDQRIGSSFLAHGAGFGGSCLTKDVSGLVATAESLGCQTPIARAALDVNTWARHRLVDRLEALLGSLRGRKVAVLGLAFKPGTDDVRDSPAVTIIDRLTERGSKVATYDPVAKAAGLEHLRRRDPYAAIAGADAVVVATGWPEFALLDPARVAAEMAGTVVLDAAGVLDPDAADAFGLEVTAPGRATSDTLHPVMVPPLEWALDAAIA
jgi:UDPglucose 6-dehydrogenase